MHYFDSIRVWNIIYSSLRLNGECPIKKHPKYLKFVEFIEGQDRQTSQAIIKKLVSN